MNTYEILKEFSNEPNFIGVYPRDRLPKVNRTPVGLVINTDTSAEPGEHWVAIYLDDATGEYFDSFGERPAFEEIYNFLEKHCPGGWKYNAFALQGLSSTVCGQHCIFYLRMRLMGRSFSDVLNFLARNNPALNDSLVDIYKRTAHA
jgi:hypothetical protein